MSPVLGTRIATDVVPAPVDKGLAIGEIVYRTACSMRVLRRPARTLMEYSPPEGTVPDVAVAFANELDEMLPTKSTIDNGSRALLEPLAESLTGLLERCRLGISRRVPMRSGFAHATVVRLGGGAMLRRPTHRT